MCYLHIIPLKEQIPWSSGELTTFLLLSPSSPPTSSLVSIPLYCTALLFTFYSPLPLLSYVFSTPLFPIFLPILWNLCCSVCLFSPPTWQPSPQPVATVTRQGGREGGGKKSKVTKRERETLRGMRDAVCVRVEMGGERARWEMWH